MSTTVNIGNNFPENLSSFKSSSSFISPLVNSADFSILKKESAVEMLLNKNSPGAVNNISADEQTKQSSLSFLAAASSSSAVAAAASASTSVLNSQSRRLSNQHLLHSNSLGPAECFKVGDALPFNLIETQPLQIKKLFAPGRTLPEEFQKIQSCLFDDEYGTPSFNPNYRKRGAKRKFFSKISHSVEKRNARERTRVHTVNQAFTILKVHLPTLRANAKRVSKLKILRTAIDYIDGLKALLQNDNQSTLNNTLRLALENDNHFAKNVFAAPAEEPKQPTTSLNDNEEHLGFSSKSYQPNAAFLAETNPDSLASVFAANAATAAAAENIRASSLFTQAFDTNHSSALIKFPYVGYENLYNMRSGHNYMTYPQPSTTNINNEHGESLPGANISYPTDPNAFYYHNVPQTTDYSALNSTTTNVYF